MNLKNLSACAAALLLVACAPIITEIVPAGKDTYVVAGDDGFEVESGTSIKTSLYKKANAHCEAMGKKLFPLNESTSSYAAELRFRCLDEVDPEYVRPTMKSVPNIRIER
tara:strand:- start:280258 stop:280587 length:330 start_codon:yes stop_codon:yes gene_type:complete